MAQSTVLPGMAQGYLFLPDPDSDLADILAEAEELCDRFPEILERIEADQDRLGLERKKLRIQEALWRVEHVPTLPGLQPVSIPDVDPTRLESGRRRMSARAALGFLLITEYTQGTYSRQSWCRIRDSLTVMSFVARCGMNKVPCARTIGNNVNAISLETREFIHQCQLKLAREDGLDEFDTFIGDSTAVAANTRWPTDSGLLFGLLRRAFRLSQQLERYRMRNFRVHRMNQWLKKLKQLDFQINTAHRQRKRNKLYRSLLKTCGKAITHMASQAIELHERVKGERRAPVMQQRLERRWAALLQDLGDACGVYQHCSSRVQGDPLPKAAERVLSLSDRSAAYIVKGQREAVIGYRVQVARSGNGLVSAVLVPEGNQPDSTMLLPLFEQAERLTGVKPSVVSLDDGYTSTANLKALAEEVSVVSFSGSKGRKLLGDELWDDPAYEEARRTRSTVESLIFCLKHIWGMYRVRRRGIEAVRQEILGKVLLHNFSRISMLRKGKLRRTPPCEPVAA